MISIEDLQDAEKASMEVSAVSISFDRLSIVPKPALNSVEIQFALTGQEPYTVVLQDENKQVLVFDERNEKNLEYARMIELADYPVGNYYLIITQGSSTYCKKLLKQLR